MDAKVDPGLLDWYAERVFSNGACAGLAIALSRATGWPLVKVTDAYAVYDRHGVAYTDLSDREREHVGQAGMGAGGIHWLVLAPDGSLVDVDGAHTPAQVLELWDGEGVDDELGRVGMGLASMDDAVEEYVEAKGEPVSLAVCATFVPEVLARAGR